MKYFLKNDITSILDRKRVYGKAGDEVTVISDHENVMIVMDLNGNKFSCDIINLSGGPVSEKSETKFINKIPAKKNKQSKPVQLTPQLF